MNSGDARPSLKEKQRQEREALILQAAEKTLLEKGYHEMSMDEIATQVGIAKSTVYLHFPGKEDLVVALLERKMTQFLALIVETTKLKISAREKLDIIFQRMYLQRAAIMRGAGVPLLVSLYNSSDMHPIIEKVGARVKLLAFDVRRHLLAILQAGQEAGEFDAVLPAEVMLGCFFSMLSPLTYGRLTGEQDISLDDLVKYVKYMYFKSIASDAIDDHAERIADLLRREKE